MPQQHVWHFLRVGGGGGRQPLARRQRKTSRKELTSARCWYWHKEQRIRSDLNSETRVTERPGVVYKVPKPQYFKTVEVGRSGKLSWISHVFLNFCQSVKRRWGVCHGQTARPSAPRGIRQCQDYGLDFRTSSKKAVARWSLD